MDRVRLSMDEKTLLRYIAQGSSYRPDGFGEAKLAAVADSLQGKGLIAASFASGHELVSAELTHHGAMYLQENPHLKNPVEWAKVASICSIVTVILSIIALLIGCSIMNR